MTQFVQVEEQVKELRAKNAQLALKLEEAAAACSVEKAQRCVKMFKNSLSCRRINARDTKNNMHTYIHTYVHTYIHRYIHRYIHTYTSNSVCKLSPLRSDWLSCEMPSER